MRRSSVVLVVLALAAAASPASADGPQEPNERPDQAFGPLTGDAVAGALETPQDIDWYRFYAKADRQIGVLAVQLAPCPSTSGSMRIEVFDGDVRAYSASLGTVRLGYTGRGDPTTAGRVAFTAKRGHRYFVRAQQSVCQNAGYGLQVGAADALTSELETTVECVAAHDSRHRASTQLARLRSARKKARGQRRWTLTDRITLEQQQVVTLAAAAIAACTRPALTGYPYD